MVIVGRVMGIEEASLSCADPEVLPRNDRVSRTNKGVKGVLRKRKPIQLGTFSTLARRRLRPFFVDSESRNLLSMNPCQTSVTLEELMVDTRKSKELVTSGARRR